MIALGVEGVRHNLEFKCAYFPTKFLGGGGGFVCVWGGGERSS